MAPSPIRNLRVADERWAAWGEAAAARGVSVAALVHAGVELLLVTEERDLVGRAVARIAEERAGDGESISPPSGFDVVPVPSSREARLVPEAVRVPRRRRRTDYCEHRRGPDEYCSRCDA